MAGFRELSTVDVIRAATAIYLRSSSHSSSNLSLLDHFCGGSAINISEEESKDVELVHLLILCAEKIGSQQFDRSAFKASATQVWLFKLSELDIVYRPSLSIKRQSITDFSTEFTDNLEEDWMEIDGEYS